MIQGQSLVCIDNVVGEARWRRAVPARSNSPGPACGSSGNARTVEIDARSVTYFANGNNITIVGDLCRRVIRSRLDAQMERPELREFKGDPADMIMADRGKYIAACLTICRAYIAAGRPGRPQKLASFGEWSDTVRSALVWLGEADPVKSMDLSKAEDPETAALLVMLNEWKTKSVPGQKNGMRCATSSTFATPTRPRQTARNTSIKVCATPCWERCRSSITSSPTPTRSVIGFAPEGTASWEIAVPQQACDRPRPGIWWVEEG